MPDIDLPRKKKAKVMVVEDDSTLSSALMQKLTLNDFVVENVLRGDLALESDKLFNPDIILLGLVLPGKNGFEVLKELKSNEELPNIPVIIMSNLAQIEDVYKAGELGAVEFLVKSDISIDSIIKKIRITLNLG